MKKNWSVTVNGLSFMMGGTDEMSKAEALRTARLIWPDSEVA